MGLTIDDAERLGIAHEHPDHPGRRGPKAKPRRLNALGQNKTEARMDRWLEHQKRAGVVADFDFEGIKLRLAGRTYFTPDFDVWMPDGRFCFIECKGTYIRDDAMVKLKVAAEHSYWPFYLAVFDGKRWDVSELPSRSKRGPCLDVFLGI